MRASNIMMSELQDTMRMPFAAGETVAVKSVDASNFRSIAQIDQIQDEISVLSGLKHPCIIRLLDIFYFVMEYAAGGCLVDYVRKQVGLARIPTSMRQVLLATACIHIRVVPPKLHWRRLTTPMMY